MATLTKRARVGPVIMLIDGQDVTKQFDTDKAMVFDQGLRTHSPGPNGLPGGYPVRLSAEGAEVVLPPEITLDEAIKMNEASGKLDAIEEIKDDGTVVFADYT